MSQKDLFSFFWQSCFCMKWKLGHFELIYHDKYLSYCDIGHQNRGSLCLHHQGLPLSVYILNSAPVKWKPPGNDSVRFIPTCTSPLTCKARAKNYYLSWYSLQSSQLENVLNSFQSCDGENRAAGNKKHTASKPNLPLLCLYNICLIFERHSINKNTQGKHYIANCHVFKLWEAPETIWKA